MATDYREQAEAAWETASKTLTSIDDVSIYVVDLLKESFILGYLNGMQSVTMRGLEVLSGSR